MKSDLKGIGKKILLCLCALQIVMGVLTVVCQFGTVQDFRETRELMVLAEGPFSDAYTGILYPALLYVAQGILGGTSIPFSAFMEVLQLVAAFGAGVCLLNRLQTNLPAWKKYFASGYLLTIPWILQMHMAILPWSFLLSACMLYLAGLFGLEKREKGKLFTKELLYLLIGFGGMVLLVPAMLYLAGGIALVYVLLHRKKSTLLVGGGLLVAAGVAILLNTVSFHAELAAKKIDNSFEAAMVSRFVWPNFSTNYYFWPEEVKEVMSIDDAVALFERENRLADDFGPKMEKAFGKEQANRYYMEMALECLKDRTKEDVFEIGQDFFDYLTLPFTLQKNLLGIGTSQTAWNYSRFLGNTPSLVAYYVRISFWSMLILLLGAIVQLRSPLKKEGCRRGLLAILLWYTFWYTMSGNMPIDAKQALPILLIWGLMAVSSILFEGEDNESCAENK